MGETFENLTDEELCDMMCGDPEELLPMKYIIMCGWCDPEFPIPKQLTKLRGETVVERTIRLLRENGIEDISISSNNPLFEGLGVPVLHHENRVWLDAFYPTDEPTCYIFGDVIFSPQAIKTIVETETDDVEFFASAPPFSPEYPKKWAEPFAFKVRDQASFRLSIMRTKSLVASGSLRRGISWDLWTVHKGTPLNRIIYTNYTAINDYTCDIDHGCELPMLQAKLDNTNFLKD